MQTYFKNKKWAAALLVLMASSGAYGGEGKPHSPRIYNKHPELMEASRQYSVKMVQDHPELGQLLQKLDLQYLHQLDPTKVYVLDRATGLVRQEDAPAPEPERAPERLSTAEVTPASFAGLASAIGKITADPGSINGLGRTVITCPFGGQEASVTGFMASTVARDPFAGIRNGFLTQDNFLTTAADVNFSVIKVSGGAKNPINRTTMETTHMGSCGSEIFVRALVSTWPPLRVEMVIDDTGSMGGELAGLKSALVNFISSRNSNPEQVQRAISYELISFKDSPSVRLANTEDTAAAISAVQSLYASGGGDCPEDALGGLGLALSRVEGGEDYEGAIILATDASPHSGDVGGLIARAQAAGVPVNVLLTGDCVAAASLAATTDITSTNGEQSTDAEASSRLSAMAVPSARVVFEQIANETGGAYVYAPGRSAAEYALILEEMFKSAVVGGDKEPPVVTVTVTPELLWPPNHELVPIAVSVSATDNKDPDPRVEIESVTSNEPDNGPGDGNTEQDIVIGADGSVSLRAERSGGGDGRIYTIMYRATDAAGNVGYGSAEVRVTHSRGR